MPPLRRRGGRRRRRRRRTCVPFHGGGSAAPPPPCLVAAASRRGSSSRWRRRRRQQRRRRRSSHVRVWSPVCVRRGGELGGRDGSGSSRVSATRYVTQKRGPRAPRPARSVPSAAADDFRRQPLDSPARVNRQSWRTTTAASRRNRRRRRRSCPRWWRRWRRWPTTSWLTSSACGVDRWRLPPHRRARGLRVGSASRDARAARVPRPLVPGR